MIEKGTSGLKTADRFHRQRNQPACVPALRINRRRNCCCGSLALSFEKKRHKNLNDAIIWELEANYDSSECLF